MELGWLDLGCLPDTHSAALSPPSQGVRSFNFGTLMPGFAMGTCLEAGIADTCCKEVIFEVRHQTLWCQEALKADKFCIPSSSAFLLFFAFHSKSPCFRVSVSACTYPSRPFLLWAHSNVFLLMGSVETFQCYKKAQSFVTSQRQSESVRRQMSEMEMLTGLSAWQAVGLVTVQFTSP